MGEDTIKKKFVEKTINKVHIFLACRSIFFLLSFFLLFFFSLSDFLEWSVDRLDMRTYIYRYLICVLLSWWKIIGWRFVKIFLRKKKYGRNVRRRHIILLSFSFVSRGKIGNNIVDSEGRFMKWFGNKSPIPVSYKWVR